MTKQRPPEPPTVSGRTLVIGITGGMASGKSTVARMFASYGFPHLDADQVVHELLRHDAGTIAEIATAFPEAAESALPLREGSGGGGVDAGHRPSSSMNTFSPDVPRKKEGINRAALAASITANPETLARLEAILHPRVRATEEHFIAAARAALAPAVILDIPLLFETDAHLLCDHIVVTHAPLAHRKTRAFTRPGMSEDKWQRLLTRQLSNHHEHPRADVVIDTGVSEIETRKYVTTLLKKWSLC